MTFFPNPTLSRRLAGWADWTARKLERSTLAAAVALGLRLIAWRARRGA